LSAAGFADRLIEISAELAAVAGHNDLLLRRASFAVEELAEWLHAHAKNDLNAAADALGDRFYVLLGDAVASGMPLGPIFNEVHRSNMTKTSRLSDGKGRKGNAYVPPDIERVLDDYNLSRTCQATFDSDDPV
jgi:predicted HAD superfamily Cof-like phosphohydrolase